MAKRKFAPAFRLQLEKADKNPLQSAAMNTISEIETQIRNGMDRTLFDEAIEQARDRYWTRKQDMIQSHKSAIQKMREIYQKEMERHPEREMLKLRQAELKTNSMTPQERENRVEQIAAGTEVPADHYEAQILRQHAGENVDLYDQVVRQHRIDQPWINTPEATQIANQLDQLQSLKGAEVDVDGYHIDLGELIDVDLELEQEAN